jgi:ferric-dicitrate binding protein FerR (iron transport regulator)
VVDRWTRREFGPQGLRDRTVEIARDAFLRLRKLPRSLDQLDAAIQRAAAPPSPPPRRRNFAGAAALWFMGGVLVAGLGAAALWWLQSIS